jgi:hypothetical protein
VPQAKQSLRTSTSRGHGTLGVLLYQILSISGMFQLPLSLTLQLVSLV